MGWDDIERTGHNPTTYLDAAEQRYYESGQWLADEERKNWKPENGCWNCLEYDGNHCMKEWNNADPDYYVDWRDEKKPDDYCDDWDHDEDAVWEQFFDFEEE